jgi:hypothetical protein
MEHIPFKMMFLFKGLSFQVVFFFWELNWLRPIEEMELHISHGYIAGDYQTHNPWAGNSYEAKHYVMIYLWLMEYQ